jgi:hypothetical protein
MNGLMEQLDRRVEQRHAANWARLAELLALGDQAPASAVGELQNLMLELRLDVDQVKAFAATRREIDALAAEAARLPELQAEATTAMGEWTAAVERVKAETRRLEDEERAARHKTADTQSKVNRASEAVARLDTLRLRYAWMLRGADGTPALPEVRVSDQDLPPSLDARAVSIDPAGVYSPEELGRDFGVQAGWLERAGVPQMEGSPGHYFGAVVLAWLCTVNRLMRERHRARLRERLVRVDPRLLTLEPDRVYDPRRLADLGWPAERFRLGKEFTPARRSDGSLLGSEVMQWAREAEARNRQTQLELDAMDAEDAGTPAAPPASAPPAPAAEAPPAPPAAEAPPADEAPVRHTISHDTPTRPRAGRRRE